MYDRKELIEEFRKFFENLGINPIYPALFVILIINYFNLKKIKLWNTMTIAQKLYIIAGIIGAIIGLYGVIFVEIYY